MIINFVWKLFNSTGLNITKTHFGYKIARVVCFIILIISVILPTAHIVIYWVDLETLGKSELIPASVGNAIYYILVTIYPNDWTLLFKTSDDLWKTSETNKKIKQAFSGPKMFVTKFLRVYLTICLMCVVAFLLKALVHYKQRQMPITTYPFCDLQGIPCYVFTYTFAMYCGCTTALVNTSFDCVFVVIIGGVIGHYRYIRQEIQSLNLGIDPMEKSLRELREIINHHNMILDYVRHINATYSFILVLIFWINTATTCLSVFLITMKGIPPEFERFSQYVCLLNVFILQLLLYCTGGSLLIDEGLAISDVLYATNWYIKTQKEVRMTLALMNLRANKPCGLRIGGMSNLELPKFTTVFNMALSFYTLMDDMNKGNK